MGKKVRVVTSCGDEHFYSFDQDVKSVEVVEEKEITELRGVRFDNISRAFGAMPKQYVVRVKREEGNIVINGCGVLNKMWPHLVEHCSK